MRFPRAYCRAAAALALALAARPADAAPDVVPLTLPSGKVLHVFQERGGS